MDPSYFRGSQPPTSHVVPGAPSIAGQPPYVGFIEPPFIIPGAFLTETIMAIHNEFASQNRLVRDQYSSVSNGYSEMNGRFELYVRQTDRILAEQYARFEVKLEGIQRSMCQFQESQTAAITDLRGRLGTLEGLVQDSRGALASETATVIGVMGHGFDGLAAMIKDNEHATRRPFSFQSGVSAYDASLGDSVGFSKLSDGSSCPGDTRYESRLDRIHGSKELVPATRSQADSDTDINATPTLASHSSLELGEPQEEQAAELPPVAVLSDTGSPSTSSGDNSETDEQDQLCGGDTPPPSTPATEEPSDPPTMDTSDVTMVPAPPPTIPSEDIPTTLATDCDPLQDPPLQNHLFDTTSPLTQISTPRSQDQDEPEAFIVPPEDEELPENAISTSHPTSSNTTSRKRKRTSYGHSVSKGSRRNRKSRPQATREDVAYRVGPSEGSHADPSIWPPTIEGGDSSQKYVECDRCAQWFHFGCVGLKGDHQGGTYWECPSCVFNPTRNAETVSRESSDMCFRPDCAIPKGGEYFMDRLFGRCYVPDQGVVKYLVAYDGYTLNECTWEPPENFANDSSKIEEFLEWWATENPGVGVESLNPRETIFLHEAYVLARAGVTWTGA